MSLTQRRFRKVKGNGKRSPLERLAFALATVLVVAGVCALVAFVGFLAYGVFDDRFHGAENVGRWANAAVWGLMSLIVGVGLQLLSQILQALERIEETLSRDSASGG